VIDGSYMLAIRSHDFHMVRKHRQKDAIAGLTGAGWGGGLDEMRRGPQDDHGR
jgi:hypothetical protein